MANVMFSLQQSAVSALSAVNSVTSVVTAGTGALADMATAASLHASAYRKDTEATIKLTENDRRIVGGMQARLAIAVKLISIQEQLDANPTLAAMYEKVGLELKAA